MATAISFLPNGGLGLQMSAVKVGGVYRKPMSARKRAELVRTLHDPTPKAWELKEPKGVRHEASKIKRKELLEKNLKTVARQMPDRIKKHPKREERIGHQWFKPSFEQRALKYFREKSVASINLGKKSSKRYAPTTIGELALHLLRKSELGVPVPAEDKPKLLIQLENRGKVKDQGKDAGSEKKKKKKK